MERPSEQQTGEVDLRTKLAPLKTRKKQLAYWALAGALIGLVYTIVTPASWKADATVLMVLDSDALGGAGGAAASAFSGLSPTAPDPLQVLEGVLVSKSSIDQIIKKTHYDRLTVEKGFKTERKQKAAQLSFSWEDKDPKVAKMVVQTGLDNLQLLQHSMGFTTAELQAQFLEASVHDNEVKLADDESALASYEKHMSAPINPTDPTSAGTYLMQRKNLQIALKGIDAQLKALRAQAKLGATQPDLPTAVPTVGKIREGLITLQTQLQTALTQFGPDSPTVIKLQREISDDTRSAIDAGEISKYLVTVDKNLEPNVALLEGNKLEKIVELQTVNDLAEKAPDEAVELARLAREVTIRGTIYTDLRTKWEEAKVAAHVDRVKWSVLEEPYVEDKPTNKHYLRTPVLTAILGLVLGAGYMLNKIKKQAVTEAEKSAMA